MSRMAVDALREHRESQRHDRAAAGVLWQEHGLVFATAVGTPLDAGNVQRMFKDVCRAAGIGDDWTPRELRNLVVTILRLARATNIAAALRYHARRPSRPLRVIMKC